MEEIWIDIKHWEGHYQISNNGRVRSLDRIIHCKKRDLPVIGKILRATSSKDGYLTVWLSKNGFGKMIKIHRLIAEHFIDNPLNLLIVNHINGIKSDNRIENLEWCTHSQNLKHAFKTGLNKGRSKPVLQYSMGGSLIKRWPNAKSVKKLKGFNAQDLTDCLLGRTTSYKGNKWRYES